MSDKLDREFINSTEKGIDSALTKIKERYELSQNPKNNLLFHNSFHTKQIIYFANKILLIVKQSGSPLVGLKELQLVRLASAFHDLVQEWDEVLTICKEGPIILRTREPGKSEAKSIEAAFSFMNKTNQEVKVFKQNDFKVVEESILATITQLNKKTGEIKQPYLSPGFSLVAKAIALAEMGSIGIGGLPEAQYESDTLFLETNIDIYQTLLGLRQITISKDRFYQKRAYHWLKAQKNIFKSRRENSLGEIEMFPQSAIPEITKLFGKLDEVITGWNQVINQRRKLTLGQQFINIKKEIVEHSGTKKFNNI